MARSRRPAASRVLAQGKGSVAIAGDVTNSVIVTGDNATLKLELGPESGALLELLEKSRRPTRQLRPMPLQGAPPAFPDRIDRETEAAAVLDWGEPPRAVNLYGDSGIGKSYVLALAANDPAARGLPDGVVSLFAKSLPLQDVLQACFEEFWDCEPPYKASDVEIRRSLRDREAVVVVDSVELPPDEAQALAGAVPNCRLVLASREQTLWDGRAVELEGLTEADALVLFERELGRPLGADGADAAAICRAVDGHPLKIRQFAATTRRSGRALSDLRAEVEGADGSRRLLLEQASPEEERVLRVLALLDGASVGEEWLAELTALPNAGAVAAQLADKRLVRTHSPRYSIDSALAGEIASHWPLEEDEEWVLTATARWAEARRAELGEVAQELDALVALFRRATRRPGAEKLVVRLGRAIDAALVSSRRFGSWGEILAAVLAAAERLGDPAAVAWALHQSGVREVALGRVRLGRQLLRRSERIRRSLDDEVGLATTRHNLAVARPRLAFLGPLGALPLATVPLLVLALVLASGGGAAAWFLSHHSQRPVTPGSSSTTSTSPRRPLSVRVVGSGEVRVDPSGLRCSGRCRFELSLEAVMLSARAVGRRPFLRWEGDCEGNAPCRLRMDRSRRVVAIFGRKIAKTARLEVEFVGKGGGRVNSTPAGLDCTDNCAAPFPVGATVTLEAKAGARSTFVRWSGAGCSGNGLCQVTMSAARHLSARFGKAPKTTSSTSTETSTTPSTTDTGSTTTQSTTSTTGTTTTTPTYTLNTKVGLGGAILERERKLTCEYKTPCGPLPFPAGTTLLLIARPGGDYETARWGGACSGTPPTRPCRLTMNADKTVSVSFARAYTVAISVGPGGEVGASWSKSTFTCTSEASPCQPRFRVGTVVTFKANPLESYDFTGWEGDCSHYGHEDCTLTIAGDGKIVAAFKNASE